nr:mechanosensitive ion channel family protein [uncultured Holophaga sp.]
MPTFLTFTKTYLAPVAVALILWFILWLARKILVSRLSVLAERTENQLDDLLVAVLEKTRGFALLATGLYVGSRWLPLSPKADSIVQRVYIVLLLLQGALWASAAITFLFTRPAGDGTERSAANKASMKALAFTARIVVWSVFLLLCLDNLGVNITSLVAGLGVGGIAVALAVQNVLGDLFASLSIVLDKPFEIGDFIVVGEEKGTVEHVGLKTTRISSLTGEQIVISNSDLLKSRIHNFKRMTERRILFTLGVTYQTPHAKLEPITRMLREIIEAQPCTRFDRAHLKGFGDSALLYEVVYFMTEADYQLYMNTQQTINLEIFKAFEQEGIEFAYPTQTLFVTQNPAP